MRIALIDGSNIFEAARSNRIQIDYARLREFLNEDNQLLRAYYFTALIDKTITSPVRKTVDWLSHNQYICVTKEAKEYPVVEQFLDKQTGKVTTKTTMKLKGNVDIDIASYAFVLASNIKELTEVWLFSGDGDFTVMVKQLQDNYPLKVYVVSAIGMVSTELRRQADRFINICDIEEDIRRIG